MTLYGRTGNGDGGSSVEVATSSEGVRSRLQPIKGELREIPSLLRQLGNETTRFFDQKLALAKVEIKQEIRGYLRDSVIAGIGIVLGVLGLMALNMALGCLLARLFPFSLPVAFGLGFLCMTILNGIGCAVLLMMFRNRVRTRHIMPERTVNELKRDKQWLQNEVM
jgi:uncharacterized membrane protein YqjE